MVLLAISTVTPCLGAVVHSVNLKCIFTFAANVGLTPTLYLLHVPIHISSKSYLAFSSDIKEVSCEVHYT